MNNLCNICNSKESCYYSFINKNYYCTQCFQMANRIKLCQGGDGDDVEMDDESFLYITYNKIFYFKIKFRIQGKDINYVYFPLHNGDILIQYLIFKKDSDLNLHDRHLDLAFNNDELKLINGLMNNKSYINIKTLINFEGIFKYLENNNNKCYIKWDETDLYFYKYIDVVLTNAIRDILNIKDPLIIPNFLANTKCDQRFKIVIADLDIHFDKWNEKIKNYLKRDYQIKETIVRKQETKMMDKPPESYIKKPQYYHFIAIDIETENIVGYCICKLYPMKHFYYNPMKKFFDESDEKLKTFNSIFGVYESDNINFKLFINHIKSNYNNRDDLKTNCLYIHSLSVDKEYRGGNFRIGHFLVYNSLLFALNAKELNIGCVGVESVADATQYIVRQYFSFTEYNYILSNNYLEDILKPIKEKKKFIHKIIFYIEKITKDLNSTESKEFNKGARKEYVDIYDTLIDNMNYEELEIIINKLESSKSFLELGRLYARLANKNELLNENIPFKQEFNNLYKGKLDFTDILCIWNPTFLQKMDEYSDKLRRCIKGEDNKKRKRAEEEIVETKKKKKKLKCLLTNDQLNKIFI